MAVVMSSIYPANQKDAPPETPTYCDHLLEIPTNFAKAAFPDASIAIEKFLKYLTCMHPMQYLYVSLMKSSSKLALRHR